MMTQTKIQGKFYPLQHTEWLRACHELTPAQRDVLYFIRTLDPYGEGLEVSIAEIARQLSTDQKTVHRSTVSRALKELDAKGFIDLELLMVKVNVKAKGIHCCDEATGCDETTVLSPDNERDHDATSVIMTQRARSLRNKRPPEPSSDKGSDSLRSNKTYKDFIDSLSETEREKFLEFGLKKAAELPKPPTLAEKWVEKHHQELYEQFQKTPEGKTLAPSQNWANHPQRDEWIEQIRQGKPRFIVLYGPEEEQEIRRQFANWAEANNLVWGAEL
ncbi:MULTISPECIES: MarR family transcriptional regulator [unclassified Coleofasciculus]|uniref:MarR family transcriptional regulator n=1 Tax=unclassified Coleofasciculus TaxID=2692782 RepID=UPI001D134BC2|nr:MULTISPECIES: helix-turn-helix domain-containing protein [unclassified Coleofasciculus]